MEGCGGDGGQRQEKRVGEPTAARRQQILNGAMPS